MRNKYKIEKKSDVELAQEDAAAKASDIRDTVADKADDLKKGAAAGVAALTGKAADARDAVADKSDLDKDSFLEDVLPKVLEFLAGAAAAGTAAKTLRSDSTPATTGTYAGYTGAQGAVHTGGDVRGAQQNDDYTKMLMDVAKVAASFFAAKKATSVATDKASDVDLGSKLSGLQDKVSDMDLGKKVAGAAFAKKAADKVSDSDDDLDVKELAKKAAAAGVSTKALEKARKKQEKKGGKGLITLGLLASAAAVAAVIYKQTAPQDDPWATPLADPYTGPQSSSINTGTTGTTTTTTYSTTSTTDATPVTSDREAGDPLSAVSTEPVILDAKDQEGYASSTPSDATGFDRTDDGAGQHTDHNAGTDRPDRDKF